MIYLPLDSNVELVPDLRARLSKCAITGIARHTHYEAAQIIGRELLEITRGSKKANEILADHSTDGSFVSQEVSTAVFESVLALQDTTLNHEGALMTIESLFDLMKEESNQNDTFTRLLLSVNAIQTILDATQRVSVATLPFLHRAGGVLGYLIGESHELTTLLLNKDGFRKCADIAISETTDAFVSITFIGVIFIGVYNLASEERASVGVETS